MEEEEDEIEVEEDDDEQDGVNVGTHAYPHPRHRSYELLLPDLPVHVSALLAPSMPRPFQVEVGKTITTCSS